MEFIKFILDTLEHIWDNYFTSDFKLFQKISKSYEENSLMLNAEKLAIREEIFIINEKIVEILKEQIEYNKFLREIIYKAQEFESLEIPAEVSKVSEIKISEIIIASDKISTINQVKVQCLLHEKSVLENYLRTLNKSNLLSVLNKESENEVFKNDLIKILGLENKNNIEEKLFKNDNDKFIKFFENNIRKNNYVLFDFNMKNFQAEDFFNEFNELEKSEIENFFNSLNSLKDIEDVEWKLFRKMGLDNHQIEVAKRIDIWRNSFEEFGISFNEYKDIYKKHLEIDKSISNQIDDISNYQKEIENFIEEAQSKNYRKTSEIGKRKWVDANQSKISLLEKKSENRLQIKKCNRMYNSIKNIYICSLIKEIHCSHNLVVHSLKNMHALNEKYLLLSEDPRSSQMDDLEKSKDILDLFLKKEKVLNIVAKDLMETNKSFAINDQKVKNLINEVNKMKLPQK